MSLLVIGATGMLGRPVVRRLVQDGFEVRVLVRNEQRARRRLPDSCEFVTGDLRDERSLDNAMRGVDAVYVNLATPFSPEVEFDPERDGTRAVIEAARRGGVRRLLRISALGVQEGAGEWWAAKRRSQTDHELLDSGLDWTVFRPTWFMESLPLFAAGSFMMLPKTPTLPLYWIAGDDYGRQVAAALQSQEAIGKTYVLQGPEPVAFRDALRRFAHAINRRLLVLPLPGWLPRFAGRFNPQARYLVDLLHMTFTHCTEYAGDISYPELPRPTMTIEDYAAYVERTGDFPSK